MAITKVWIEEGCIVCNACEAECPEVFHVTDTSCNVNGAVREDGVDSENRDEQSLLSGSNGTDLEAAIEAVQGALKQDDAAAMKSAEEKLTEVWHTVSSDIYSKAREKSSTAGGQQAPPPDAGAQSEGGAKQEKKTGDVVDADFEVVDDDKKK